MTVLLPWFALVVTILAGWAIIKRLSTSMVLLFAGLAMISFAVICGVHGFLPKGVKPSGFVWFDIFELLRSIATKQTSGIGLLIMVAGGYAAYMDRIGAAHALVRVCVKPLDALSSPYLVLVMGYLIGQALVTVIPSAAGLAMLLLVALFPILRAVGCSAAASAAVIGTSAGMTLGPASGTANLAAQTAGLEPIIYFVQCQLPVAIPTLIVVAICHYFVQKYYDKKNDDVYSDAILTKKDDLRNVPGWYAILPVLPIALMIVFSKLVYSAVKLNTISALLLVWVFTIIVELIRRRDFKPVLADGAFIFKAMGGMFSSIVALIICAEFFATGLKVTGLISALITHMVTRQLTVDKDMKDADRTYVLANEIWAGGHILLGDKLQSRYPEIEDWCAVSGYYEQFVRTNDQPVNIQMMFVRENFFRFFNFHLLEGNPETLLANENNIVLTRSCAIKLFGTEHALGKTLIEQAFGDRRCTVSGIIEDIDNSIFPSNIEAFSLHKNVRYVHWSASEENTQLGNAASCIFFLRFHPSVNPNDKADDIARFFKEFFWIYQYDSVKKVLFIPVHKFYFSDTQAAGAILNQYSLKVVLIFLTIGVLILFMAIFNYTSMSIAQTSYRAKEMATRRLLGSSKKSIFWRMIAESFLLTTLAFVIGFLLAKAAEPTAMELLHTRLDIVGDLNPLTLLCYLLLITVLSLLSGFVPATLLSRYNPLDIVKGTFRRKTKTLYLRLLNIVQNGLTIAMLGCAIYLSVQIYRILHAPLGYEYGHVIHYPPMGSDQKLQLFRQEAQKLPFVKRVSFAQGTPINGGNNDTMYFTTADSTKDLSFQTFVVDSAFIDIFHIQITEDRHAGYNPKNFFVSQSAMKDLRQLGFTDFVRSDRGGYTMNVVGDFKDFQIRSLLMKDPHPLRMQIAPSDSISPWNILVEVRDDQPEAYKKQLDQLYSKIIDGYSFDSEWYDTLVQKIYEDITRMNHLILIFTCAALVISLLGLTAMSIYFIAQRKRDIAVRKVFGSDSRSEMLRLMKFSSASLAVSLLIGLPLMYIGIQQIDKIVTYESNFPWWVPVAAFLIVALISLASVWLISRKAVRENPVLNLKTE